MKFLLILTIIFGTPQMDDSLVTQVAIHTFDSKKECEGFAEQLKMRSVLPVKEARVACVKQEEA